MNDFTNKLVIDNRDIKLFKNTDKEYNLEILKYSNELQKKLNTISNFSIKNVTINCRLQKLDLTKFTKLENIFFNKNIELLYLSNNPNLKGVYPENIINKNVTKIISNYSY